jgi:flagellar hook protein FlgE
VSPRFNLPAGDDAKDVSLFDPNDPLTFNAATSISVYDSLGDSHVMTYYFMKDVAATNEWVVVNYIDDVPVNTAGDTPNVAGADPTNIAGAVSLGANAVSGFRMQFSSGGDFIGVQNGDGTQIATGDISTVELGNPPLVNGSDATQTIATNFALDVNSATPDEPTQFASAFEVTSLEQDGLPVGRLTGIDIGPDGLVRATFSNGTSEPVVRVALARFSNEQGLTQQSNTQWQESILSGEALAGEATTGTFGDINSSALEQANVNLTTELIDMIIAQRNFQANSRALEINNQLNQTILNIR